MGWQRRHEIRLQREGRIARRVVYRDSGEPAPGIGVQAEESKFPMVARPDPPASAGQPPKVRYIMEREQKPRHRGRKLDQIYPSNPLRFGGRFRAPGRPHVLRGYATTDEAGRYVISGLWDGTLTVEGLEQGKPVAFRAEHPDLELVGAARIDAGAEPALEGVGTGEVRRTPAGVACRGGRVLGFEDFLEKGDQP